MNRFTKIIKDKRLKLNLTQVQVSEALGFNPDYYQQIELGNKKPSLTTLIKLAKILNINIGELEELKNTK